MAKGPRPQSRATREATGSARKHPDRLNKAEPVVPIGSPSKPEHLQDNPLAAAAWDEVVRLFGEMNMLTKADGKLIESYALTYSSMRVALQAVNETGQVLDDGNGNLKRNPHSVELHKYMDRLLKLLAEMGLTPSSRTRVSANPDTVDNPFTEWLKAKREHLN